MHGSSGSNARDLQRSINQQRRFGVMLVLLTALAAWFAYAQRWPFAGVLLVLLSAALAVLAVWRPQLLRRPLLAWLALGMLLGRIVNPIILALIYYVMIAPIAMIGRWTGRDELRLKRDTAAPTYWIERDAPAPTAESFRQQF